jgi:hypothetical protein
MAADAGRENGDGIEPIGRRLQRDGHADLAIGRNLHLDRGWLETDTGDGKTAAAGGDGEPRYTLRIRQRLMGLDPDFGFGERRARLAPDSGDDVANSRLTLSQEKRGHA